MYNVIFGEIKADKNKKICSTDDWEQKAMTLVDSRLACIPAELYTFIFERSHEL